VAARVLADRALAAAGVQARPLDSLAGVRAADALFRLVWQSPDASPLTAEVMRAVEHAGGYVVGAYDGDELVAASAAFLGLSGDHRPTLHSHISGVHPAAQRRQVGWALKLHQRAWALERGIGTVTWTFDPLVRRNAWFNLHKLGAVGVEYLVDFYGPMSDGINAGVPTDRLYASWDLESVPVVHAVLQAAGPPDPQGPVVLEDVDGLPVVRPVPPADVLLVQLPPDVESMRRTAPEAATQWRLAVREVLAPLLDEGRRAVGMTRSGHVVVGA
jgi:predicted GNAT superfamily acetyltransferase